MYLLCWQAPVQPFLPLGALTLLILTAPAATSFRAAMRLLGRAWKRLHRMRGLTGGAAANGLLVVA